MEAADNFMNDLRALIADAEELLRASADQAGPRMQEARARAEESLRSAPAPWRCSRAHPWAAVGIAAAIGLVAGVVLSRK